MKIFNKTKLNVALSTAFVGMALVGMTQTASAYPEDAKDTNIAVFGDLSTNVGAGTGSGTTDPTNIAANAPLGTAGITAPTTDAGVVALGGVPVDSALDATVNAGDLLLNAGTAAPDLPYANENKLGQALVYPYYTVRNGMRTLVNVVNTSNVAVAVKVRFREAHNSRDVLDFNLVLSPYDKWSGYLVDDATNGPLLKTDDKSCTIPAIASSGAPFTTFGYLGGSFEDAGEQTIDRMREGYVEIIAMGYATAGNATTTGGGVAATTGTFALGAPIIADNTGAAIVAAADLHPGAAVTPSTGDAGNVAYNATHVSGVPRDCSKVISAFVNTVTFDSSVINSPGNGVPKADAEFAGLLPGFNPLRGSLVYINKDGGVGAGISALSIADFNNANSVEHSAAASTLPDGAYDKDAAGAAGNDDLITAQQFPFFLEPTLASRDGIWTTSGLTAIDGALNVAKISNEWASNPANGAAVDWNITFPTKSFHVDLPTKIVGGIDTDVENNIQAGVNQWRLTSVSDVVIAGASAPNNHQAVNTAQLSPFTKRFTSVGSAVNISPALFDNEETSTTSGVSFSPGTFGIPAIPYEANIVTTGITSVLGTANPQALSPATNISGSPTSGWIKIGLPTGGLPVAGFAFKERDAGNAALSFGQVMSHSYQ